MRIKNFASHRVFIIMIIVTMLSACGKPSVQTAIIGKWQAVLGAVSGLGVVIDHTEFFKDGTVTSQSKATNFIGNYKFIDDNTIRIDWKEQGAFGNSSTQIFKVEFGNEKMILTNDATKRPIVYLNTDFVEASPLNACNTDQSQSDLAKAVIGNWYADEQEGTRIDGNHFDEGRTSYAFREDGTFRYSRGYSASNFMRNAAGKYIIKSPNSIDLLESSESEQAAQRVGVFEPSITVNVLADSMIICYNYRPPRFFARTNP